ncbi:MAG: carboxylate--amine ligase, partial [Candidatus Hodarchaeota archaeon]
MHNQLYKNGPVAVVVGLSITGLGIIRSLARFGIRTIALDSNPYRPTAQTKYCEKVHYADINKEDKLIETLIAISEMNKTKPVLFFSTDNSVLIASENREVLADYYHFNLPSRSVVRIFMDKALFGDFAGKNGFQIPETLVANNFDDIRSVAKNVQYPCVIKPSLRTPTWDKTNPDKAFK